MSILDGEKVHTFCRGFVRAVISLIPALLLLVALDCGEPAAFIPPITGNPQKVKANANLVPAGRLENGTLTVHLEIREGDWYPDSDDDPSLRVQAFGEEGRSLQIPGPLIRVREGTVIQASVHNTLASTVTVHGLEERPSDDSGAVQIKAGETVSVRFQAGAPGTYYYWATSTGRSLVARSGFETQLSGAFIVDPAGTIEPDRVFVIGLWNDPGDATHLFRQVFVINGKSWPYNEVVTYRTGETVRWRWINSSGVSHPMHLHLAFFQVESVGDGEKDNIYDAASRRTVVTELMLPGHTMSLDWVPPETGRWIFHCHILSHISLDTLLNHADAMSMNNHNAGMAGLVLGIRVLPGIIPNPPDLPPVRNLKLFIRNRAATNELAAGYAYQVQEGPTEPLVETASVPGPPLILHKHEPVQITVVNQTNYPSTVHWHGITLRSYFDGLAGWGGDGAAVTPPVEPGGSFVVRFAPPRAGTFIYHTHWHDVLQLTGGLYGALIVLEPGQEFDPATDNIFVIGRRGPDGGADPLLVNGTTTPPPLQWQVGETHRLRLINITPDDPRVTVSLVDSLPVNWRPIAKDAYDLSPATPEQPAVQDVAVGETYDFEYQASAAANLSLQFLNPSTNMRVSVPIQIR